MYSSLEEICRITEKNKIAFWEVVLEDDAKEQGTDTSVSFEKMALAWQSMKEADEHYDPELRSRSNLAGGDAWKLRKRREEGKMICDDFSASVMERALRTAESNACMKRIVAAPTAGSCGVLPSVLISVQEKYSYTDEQMIQALITAGGIGGVIASRACLSGAEGGCQAEIGSASAMAAGALAFLQGGSADVISQASALALKNLLGLACDPVAGLVEVPCIKRNVIGAMNALSSADLALAGIKSRIPPDEVIDAMRSIGRKMDLSIRETGKGGLAATPTGLRINEALKKQQS
jgi:L-serine dehydratase